MDNNENLKGYGLLEAPKAPPVRIDRDKFEWWLRELKTFQHQLGPNLLALLAEMEYALVPPPEPARSGTGLWCAPGPADKQQRRFMLRFEDTDRGDVVYTEEEQAREMFARAEGAGWNCHLLAHLPRIPPKQSSAEPASGDA